MPDSTDADLDSIMTFGTTVGDLVQGTATSLTAELETISQAKIGMSGTQEGVDTMARYARLAQSGYQLSGDIGIGLMALSMGSATIAANYFNADAAQQDDMTIVNAAFNPPAGEGLQEKLAAQQQEPAGTGGPSVTVGDGQQVTLPEPTTTGPAEPSQSNQDMARVDANRDAFGERENLYDNQQVEGGTLQVDGPPVPTIDTSDLENYD